MEASGGSTGANNNNNNNNKNSVLFVCLGNICRSPMAEAVFRKMATEAGVAGDWRIDSAATSAARAGNVPDARALAVLGAHDVPVRHTARQLSTEDLALFAHVLCMDKSNLSYVKRKAKAAATKKKKKKEEEECLVLSATTAKVELLGSYDPVRPGTVIQDPYGGNHQDFQTVYKQCVRSCRAFLERNM